jgi:hypothetical protein
MGARIGLGERSGDGRSLGGFEMNGLLRNQRKRRRILPCQMIKSALLDILVLL